MNVRGVMSAILWVGAMLSGIVALTVYANRPGPVGPSIAIWPKLSRLPDPSDGLGVLVVFMHQECPCSRATLGELERLMPRIKDRARVTVVFQQILNSPSPLRESKLWRDATQIPGVTTFVDERDEEVRRFGALTSGQAYLYDGKGRLVFSGGLTPARGHRGDSRSTRIINEWINDPDKSVVARTSVFGCLLRSPASVLNHGG